MQFSADSDVSEQLRSIRIAERFFFDDKRKRSYRRFRSGMISKHSMENLGMAWWISLLQDSHVSHSLLQENARENQTKETYGLKQFVPFARLDHDTHSWRMCQDLFEPIISAKSSETWQAQGTMRNGKLYQRRKLVRRISGKDFGFWPTPLAWDWKSGNNPSKHKRYSPGLGVVVGGNLNPMWVEWLMGWPIGWTDLKPLEMDKFQQWLEKHGNV